MSRRQQCVPPGSARLRRAILIGLAGLCGLAAVREAAGQTYMPTREEYGRAARGFPEDCAQAEDVLAAGPAAERFGWALFQISFCPDRMGEAIGGVLIGLRHTDQPGGALEEVVRVTHRVEDLALLEAALQVATDPAAATVARIQAFRVLYYQVAPGGSLKYEAFLPGSTGPADPSPHDRVIEPLTASVVEGVGQTLQALLSDSTVTEPIRHAAGIVRSAAFWRSRCDLSTMSVDECAAAIPDEPSFEPPADPSLFGLSHVCEDRFILTNGNSEGIIATITLVVEGTDYRKTFDVGMQGEFLFSTGGAIGTTMLLYEDEVIATVPNDGAPPCR